MNRYFCRHFYFLLLFVAATAFFPAASFAAPASHESLERLLTLSNTYRLSDMAIEAIAAAQARHWQEETDPDKKQKKKEQFDAIDRIIKKHLNSATLVPMAMESYRQHFQQAEVDNLIAHLQTPAGKVRVEKLEPALIQSLPDVMAHFHQRIDAMFDDNGNLVTGRKMRPPEKFAVGSKEYLAAALIRETPGAREEFDLELKNIEAAMRKPLEMVHKASGMDLGKENSQAFKRVAATLRKELTFESVVAVYAKIIAGALSEAEMKMLIEDNKLPARKALLKKQKLADRDLVARLNKHVEETVLPEIISVVLK